MDPYLFCLCLSFGGLLMMLLMGFGHHQIHRGGGSHHGHGQGHGHLRIGKVSHHKDGAASSTRSGAGLMLLGLLSPRVICGVLLGFGATGLILRPALAWSPRLLAVLAVAGGVGLEALIARPLWRVLFGFASRPARTLDTLVAGEGKAATDFDAAGHGLITVQLDGQVRQVLATLIAEERGQGALRVRTGDPLFIREVNHRRNTCTVSRLVY